MVALYCNPKPSSSELKKPTAIKHRFDRTLRWRIRNLQLTASRSQRLERMESCYISTNRRRSQQSFSLCQKNRELKFQSSGASVTVCKSRMHCLNKLHISPCQHLAISSPQTKPATSGNLFSRYASDNSSSDTSSCGLEPVMISYVVEPKTKRSDCTLGGPWRSK